MANLKDLIGRLGKGPKGLGTGVTLLAAAGATVIGINQSLYTGLFRTIHLVPIKF